MLLFWVSLTCFSEIHFLEAQTLPREQIGLAPGIKAKQLFSMFYLSPLWRQNSIESRKIKLIWYFFPSLFSSIQLLLLLWGTGTAWGAREKQTSVKWSSVARSLHALQSWFARSSSARQPSQASWALIPQTPPLSPLTSPPSPLSPK